MRDRVAALGSELLAGDGLIVAVTHVSPIKAAVAWVLGADDTSAMKMFVGLASITRLTQRPAGPVLVSFNETGHLNG